MRAGARLRAKWWYPWWKGEQGDSDGEDDLTATILDKVSAVALVATEAFESRSTCIMVNDKKENHPWHTVPASIRQYSR